MKYKILILMLLAMSFLHSKVVIDPACKVTFGPSDVYISGGLQLDLVKSEEPNIDLTRKILGKDVRSNVRPIRNDVSTKSETKNANVTFDLNSRLYFIGDGDADLSNVLILHNATVAKPTGNLIMNSNLSITGNLDFQSGNVVTGANTVIFDWVSNGTLTNETATAYVVGNVQASKVVGTGTSTFGGIGFQINNTGSNLGTVTITRQAGSGNEINIYGSNGIQRKWTVGTSVAFAGTRSVTTSWLSNEDNGNVLGDLKAWKYEASKSNTSFDEDIVLKKKISLKSTAKSGIRSEREIIQNIEDDIFEVGIDPFDSRTLGWVEVDGAVFNTVSSPRTSTFTIDAATIFTINDVLNIFADGSGIESNPYQIATLAQLDNVRNYLSACFLQIADIDATPTTGWNGGLGWLPLGNSSTRFTGKYEGQHYTIDGLYIDRSATSYNGLFGYTTGAEISNVELTNVDITGGSYTGSLIGYANPGIITNSSTEGVVTGTDYIGGLVGYVSNSSSVSNSLSKGSVLGISYCGGLIGVIYSTSVTDCYTQAAVSRLSGATSLDIAGFAGYNGSSTITDSYSTGSVEYIDATSPVDKGFVGPNVGTINNSFWNIETSSQSSSAGSAIGITTNEMRTLATFTDATWDFQDEDINGTEYIWGMNYAENNAFPFLSWEGITHDPISGFAGGMGTELEPFLISTPVELDNVRNFLGASYNSTYFLQIADIDLSGYQSGEGWIPLGNITLNFTGFYDGEGHKVTNLVINRPTENYVGLFGYTMDNSEIKNIGLIDANVVGYDHSGAFIGYNKGFIQNCSATGIFSTSYGYRNGGFAGYTYMNSTITNCYSHVDVVLTSGTHTDIGAFCGRNYNGIITNCYSTGSVVFDTETNPTNRGFVATIGTGTTMSDNFWDIETSGQTSSAGAATGKTTAEMQMQSTFVNWDFTTPIWNIHISLNGGYPYFEYENRIPVLAPGNIALVYLAGDVTLTWDAVADAVGYAIYSSTDPYGTFVLDGLGAFNGEEWTKTVGDSKMFYFVTATNATKETPKVISMSNRVTDR
ncbi:MAG: hypothetical protein GQ534_10085 [Candidatus Delongbacteria bacterium]|nr:hypothetical protein [Candidatus Delongbacteria bacterium]